MLHEPNVRRRAATIAAAFAAGIFSSMAVAQESGVSLSESGSRRITSSPEVVVVATVRARPTHTGIVTPIQDVSMAASVRIDDLSPQSPADNIELQNRIWQTARRLCDQLEFQYPAGNPDAYQCVQEAAEQISDRIEASIRNDGSAPQIENP